MWYCHPAGLSISRGDTGCGAAGCAGVWCAFRVAASVVLRVRVVTRPGCQIHVLTLAVVLLLEVVLLMLVVLAVVLLCAVVLPPGRAAKFMY